MTLFAYPPIVPATGTGYTAADLGSLSIPPQMIEKQQRDNAAATKAATDRFGCGERASGRLRGAADAQRQFCQRR